MNTTQFVNRHISLNEADKQAMLQEIGVSGIDELIAQTIPDSRFRHQVNWNYLSKESGQTEIKKKERQKR